jgi:hypothetical protein
MSKLSDGELAWSKTLASCTILLKLAMPCKLRRFATGLATLPVPKSISASVRFNVPVPATGLEKSEVVVSRLRKME